MGGKLAGQRLMVLCTVPDQSVAESIATAVVGDGLAACVNIIAGIGSVYRWQGKIEQATEQLLIIKTTRAAYARLEERIAQLHPYELPEIIAVPIETGLAQYLSWIDQSTTGVNS